MVGKKECRIRRGGGRAVVEWVKVAGRVETNSGFGW